MAGSGLDRLFRNVLVVGGGIAGMAAAIRLREEGVAVTLVDNDPNWRVYGTGITLSVLTFRALCALGFKDALLAAGHAHDGVTLNDSQGRLIREVHSERLFAPDAPAEGGVLRPVLHNMMSTRVRELGTEVRLGLSVESLTQDQAGVDVVFTDGTKGRFDMVIGADGLFSRMRELLFPEAPKPKFTGQACWRVVYPLPKAWTQGQMYLGPEIKVGFTPCAPDLMYMYLLEHVPDNPWRKTEELPGKLRALLKDFGGEVGRLRDTVDDGTEIIYRPLEAILLDSDWYDGRVILIGDAAHATTPHLGSGAGMAVEDAIVLVEELKAASTIEAAFAAFMKRRLPRAKLVVGNSLKLGEMEMAGAPMPDQAALMQASIKAIGEPY